MVDVLILTNGEYGDYSFCRDLDQYDIVICADNGIRHARRLNILPDYILGDFDSSSEEDFSYYEQKDCHIIRVPSEKDETDTELALEQAISLGASKVDVYGGLGSRIDHTLGNVHLLYKALENKITMKLIDPNNEVVLVEDEIILNAEKGQLISLIPFMGAVKGITTNGLAYPLNDGELPVGKPIGVSNYMLEEEARISVKEGLLLVIKSQD